MGGWDSTATQKTVIYPETVESALNVMSKFVMDFNYFLNSKSMPNIKLGHPTGSSAYWERDKLANIPVVYGDIDLQIIVPYIPETIGKTVSQTQTYWYSLENDFVKTANPSYVHKNSSAGHPIIMIGDDDWVQVDLMPHQEHLAKWGRYRTTPEYGIKGMLRGNIFSVLGDLLNMSIQHGGVQFKIKNGIKVPFTSTRKNYELVTLTTDIETFVLDIFNYEYELIFNKDNKFAEVDSLLRQFSGSSIIDVKIIQLVNSIRGLAKSFELNNMYGRGDLLEFTNSEDFINKFKDCYILKAMKDINSAKRDKAETQESIDRAENDRKRIKDGLTTVIQLFDNKDYEF